MEKISQSDLERMIKDHKLWLNNDPNGKRLVLNNVDLSGSNLSGYNLSYCVLIESDLSYCVLIESDLSYCVLIESDLRGCDLRGCDLSNSNLSRSDLRDSDLSNSNLSRSDLSGSDLSRSNIDEDNEKYLISRYSIVNDNEEIIGYKKVIVRNKDNNDSRGYAIVKLLIPKDSKRSNGNDRKCRSEFAKVLDIKGINYDLEEDDICCSYYDRNFVYKVNEIVRSDSFDLDRWNTCSNGIHFFITKEEAINY